MTITFLNAIIVIFLYVIEREVKRTHESATLGTLCIGRRSEGGVLGVKNKQVQSEREEAQEVCCGVQMADEKLIFELERIGELV